MRINVRTAVCVQRNVRGRSFRCRYRDNYAGWISCFQARLRCSTAFKKDIHPAGLSLPVRVDELGGRGHAFGAAFPLWIQDKRKGAFPAEQIICNSRKCSPFLRTNLIISSTVSGRQRRPRRIPPVPCPEDPADWKKPSRRHPLSKGR